MTDKQHEALSALLDNEASEIDCRRLTGVADEHSKAKLNRYALMSQMLQTKTDDQFIALDICDAVSREIRSGNGTFVSESMVTEASELGSGQISNSQNSISKNSGEPASKAWAWGQMAVAASVMFVLMGTFVLLQPTQKSVQGSVAVESILDKQAEDKLLAMTSTTDSSIADPLMPKVHLDTPGVSSEVPDMLANTESKLQREKLNEYLLRHAGNGFIGAPQGVAPYARLASFSARSSE